MESVSVRSVRRASSSQWLLCAMVWALSLCSVSWASDERVLSTEEEYWGLVEQDNTVRSGFSKERKQLATAIFTLENLMNKEGRVQTAERLTRLQQVAQQQASAVDGHYADLLQWANRRRPELVETLEQRRACLKPFMARDVKLTQELGELMLAVVNLVEENQGQVAMKDDYLRFNEWTTQIRFEKLSAGVLARAQGFKTNAEAAAKCIQPVQRGYLRI